ncbi:MAG: hypothetical protein KF832_25170 [Caldilineaceae bacterium]|nr:hypothetical protein [Caldilineaceae bacterium]
MEQQATLIAAIYQIDHAKLSAAQYRAARRLLDAAGTTGHLKLTKERANELCCTTSDGATRRLLGGLQQAGIIHYSTNAYVYVDFTAWSPVEKSDHPRALLDHPRAESDHEWIDEDDDNVMPVEKSDHPRAESDHPRALLDHPRAESDHDEAATYTHARARSVCLFVDPIQSQIQEDLTNKQTPDPEEQALAFALLAYIRVKAPVAKALATEHTLQTIREAASHWWLNRKSAGGQFDETPGIVVYWLNNWHIAGVPELSPYFQHTELYLNFRTQAEIAAEQQAEMPIVQEEPIAYLPPVEAAPTEGDSKATIWRQVRAELALTMSQILYNQWVHDSHVYAVEGDTWQIAVCDERALDWLRSRLVAKVQRILESIVQQPVTVEFCLSK